MSYKIILGAILTSLAVVGLSSTQLEVHASQNDKNVYSSTELQSFSTNINNPLTFNKNNKSIKGPFDVLFHKPNDTRLVEAGTVEILVPNGISLSVINGGPQQLTWTAAVFNDTTNKLVSSYIKFDHNYDRLSIPIEKSKVKLGDKLSVAFNNDNLPPGALSNRIYGDIGIL